jgi:hypothetical protein
MGSISWSPDLARLLGLPALLEKLFQMRSNQRQDLGGSQRRFVSAIYNNAILLEYSFKKSNNI